MPIYGPTAPELELQKQQMSQASIQQLVQFMLAKKKMDDDRADTAWTQDFQNRQLGVHKQSLEAQLARQASSDERARINAINQSTRTKIAGETSKSTIKRNEAQAGKYGAETSVAQQQAKTLKRPSPGLPRRRQEKLSQKKNR